MFGKIVCHKIATFSFIMGMYQNKMIFYKFYLEWTYINTKQGCWFGFDTTPYSPPLEVGGVANPFRRYCEESH